MTKTQLYTRRSVVDERRALVPSVVLVWALVSGGGHAGQTTRAREQDGQPQREPTMALAIGGVGGAYFLASPGELVIDLEKRDRNLGNRRTHLRAILVGPDREVLRDVTIPDDGRPRDSGPGPVQRTRLSTRVTRKGVYGLNITVSQDRYGQDVVWGFRTNCPYYVIDTARGHRDERHQEPIVLLDPSKPGDVCFLPRRGAFRMELTGYPENAEAPSVYDSRGRPIQTLAVKANGGVSHEFPADVRRDAVPWRLHLPAQQATVHIDGVTRWQRGDLSPDLCLWTPELRSFFPLQRYRWILTPYQRTVYGRSGDNGEVTFRVHNNADRELAVRLALEFPDGSSWPVSLGTTRVDLGPGAAADAVLRYTVPAEGNSWVCHLRATPRDDPTFSTYSTLRLRSGLAPATAELEMPLVLTPYRHENEQFGYLPDYPVTNQVYFDRHNRPFVRTGDGVVTWRNRRWVPADLRTATAEHKGSRFAMPSTKIAFDRDNALYLIATVDRRPALLYSTDGGQTFAACILGDGRGGSFDIEQFSGHNVPDAPPPLLRFRQTAADPRLIWRRINQLDLFLPAEQNDKLSCGDPVRVSERSIGLSAHSGIPSSIVSRGGLVHVTWAEATDPKEKVPGVPTFVATYDRKREKLGEPVLIGHGPPANDVHNSPSITMDGKGHLHVLVGTHGRTFKYARSLEPNDAYGGWTEAEDVAPGLRQTYVGFVCDRDDTLHLVFRLWERDGRIFPAGLHATLSYMRKRPGQPWEPARALVVAAFSEYSIYYHRLTIDRSGRLFLSYDYWSTYWFYRTDHHGRRRALLMSADAGDTWKLAQTPDLAP